MKIYIICSVRKANENELKFANKYVKYLKQKGHDVFWPYEDAPQDDPTGWDIVTTEKEKIKNSDEVHVLWNVNSKGSHFDLGMAFAFGKPIKRVCNFNKEKDGKSYWKVMKTWEDNNG